MAKSVVNPFFKSKKGKRKAVELPKNNAKRTKLKKRKKGIRK